MAQIEYVEDALSELLSLGIQTDIDLSWQDHTILTSLNNAIQTEGALTKKQSFLLLKILSRYQNSTNGKLDLISILAAPKWRSNFRKLDYSKSISIERDQDNTLWIIMKFPYDLLKEFESTLISTHTRPNVHWDADRRVRKLNFYNFNIIQVNEFAKSHGFNIDDSFVEAVSCVEEIWQQYDDLTPYSCIVNDNVVIRNAVLDAENYFNQYRRTTLNENIFFAKQMGYVLQLDRTPNSVLEKIVSNKENHFWVKHNNQFFELYKSLNGVSVIIIDRNTKDIISWLDQFIADADSNMVSRKDIRVCFRESKESRTPLNTWIKENDLGGKIESGKIFIFKQKPAKWIFSDGVKVDIVATNSFTPINEPTTRMWIDSHPCVLFISEITPTTSRNKQIANL
jgi:hypothetical protein